MKLPVKKLSILVIVGMATPGYAELQNTVSLTAPKLFNGYTGNFVISQSSGSPSVASGTIAKTYSGVTRFTLSAASGRYAGLSGNNYYGLELGPMYVMRSILSNRFLSVVNSSQICPSSGTYNWILLRHRAPTGTNAMPATSTTFYAGGTFVYDPSGTHLITGSSLFNLAGPTVTSPSHYIDGLSGATCSSGSMKLAAGGSTTPMGAFGYTFFGDSSIITISNGGDPVVSYATVASTLTAPNMATLDGSVFSGLYTSFDAPTSQTQYNVFIVPNASGTTFTLTRSNDPDDPSDTTALGTLTCTSLNSPSNGFCSGTLALSGVGGTGKAVCLMGMGTPEKTISCSAQRPDSNTVGVTIFGVIPAKSVLALTGPASAVTASPGNSTNFNITLQNLSGRAITTLANPGGGLNLTTPFSNAGAYAGTGGTCTATLRAYSSCNVQVTYAPAAVNSHFQVFRVAYNDGYFGTVNATVPIYGTSGLLSIAVTPATASFTSGQTIQYTATATYTGGSTQDITAIATWSSNNSSVGTNLSEGTMTFVGTGSVQYTATLAGISGSRTVSVTGGTPIDVLGQADATTNAGAVTGMNGPRGMIFVGNRLILADTFNNRVLIWDSLPTSNQTPPDRVLGQPDFGSKEINYGGISSKSMYQPLSLTSDGTRLVVADSYNHRVLVWNTIPTSNYEAADMVLGQANFTSNAAATSQTGFNYPVSVTMTTGGKLFVSDFGNNRALVWNTFPTANNQGADLRLGQANFTTGTANTGGVSAQSMSAPYGIATDGTRLFVADSGNNRVLMWTTLPTTQREAADFVLGQANMTSSTANAGGLNSQALNSPRECYSSGSRLLVSDRTNNRVLIWNSMPSANRQAADRVLGQPNMTSSTANNGGISASTMFEPYGVYVDSSRAMVADLSNNRILMWTTAPTNNQQAANLVLGQPDFASSGINGQGIAYSDSLNRPSQLYSDGTKYVVADTDNHRVLIWNTRPTSDGQPADVVVGQSSMTANGANTGGVSAATLNTPRSAIIVGTKLIVADAGNHRVLIWNTVPTTNGASANVVVGQANMTSNTSAVTQSRLNTPYSLASDGTALFVADYGNNRILKWNTIPTTNGANASIRLGQANFTTGTANAGGSASSTVLSGPSGIAVGGTNLLCADYANNRVLIWTTIPTTNQPAANRVIGQANLNASGAGVTASTLTGPRGVFTNGTYVYVADTGNNRVLGWSTFPGSNGVAANRVIGQPNFTSNTLNNGGLSATSLGGPMNVFVDTAYVWIADTENYRVLISPSTASLTISDAPVYDFGDVIFNTSTSYTFVVSNSGAGSATSVAAGTPALASPFSFLGGTYPGTGGTCGGTINPQTSCTIVVRFNPTTEAASFTSAVRLTYSDGATTRVAAVGVTGRAVRLATLTYTNGATLAFGTRTIGSGTDGTLTLSNASGVAASVMKEASPGISGVYDFKGGSYPGTGGTCGSVLPTGSTCTLIIRFTPAAAQVYNSAVVTEYFSGITTSTVSINLSGTGN